MILILILVTTWCLPCQASAAASTDFEQGKQFFDSGQYDKAYPLLFEAFKQDPANADINFYLGRAAFELGDYESAIMAFERILIMNPNIQRVKLELARCHFMIGSREMARQYFKEVQSTNPPPAVWQNIELYLAAIKVSDKRNFVSGTLTFSLDYDDNVRISPVSELISLGDYAFTLTGPTSKPQDDYIYNTTAFVNHVYRFEESSFSWKSTFINYNAFYASKHDLDIDYFAVTTGPVWQNEKFMWHNHVLAKKIGVEHDRYLSAYGFGSALTLAVNPQTILNVSGKYERKNNYWEKSEDGENFIFTMGPVYTKGPNRISATYSWEHENLEDDVESYDRDEVVIRYDRYFPRDFAAFCSVDWKKTRYDQRDPLFEDRRNDRFKEWAIGVSRLLWRSEKGRCSLSAQLSHKYSSAKSNIDLYTYRKNVTALSFTFGF